MDEIPETVLTHLFTFMESDKDRMRFALTCKWYTEVIIKEKFVVPNQVNYVIKKFMKLNEKKAYDKVNITIKIKNKTVLHTIEITKYIMACTTDKKRTVMIYWKDDEIEYDKLNDLLFPVVDYKSMEVNYKNIYKNPNDILFNEIMEVFIKRIPAEKRTLTKEYINVEEIMF